MKLKRIIENLEIKKIVNFKNYNIKSITHISEDVVSDSIFICIKGNNYDGNDYVLDAVNKGAKCIVTENENIYTDKITIIVVSDIRRSMSVLAKNFYNRCIDTMKVIGVVGTSGKTTTTLMLSQILNDSGIKVGVIGTNGIYIDKIRQDNKFTTPDPLELHYIFYQMKMLGVDIVVMEVSAQSIYYSKVYGIMFDICIFTNISREHLDFFESMENYAKVKMNFFDKKNMKECVVNIDDFFGRELAYKVNIPCISYGIKEPANSFAIDMKFSLDNTKFVANILDEIFDIKMSFVGEYNVYNMLSVLTVCKMLGLSNEQINLGVKHMTMVDGRFNVYNYKSNKIIIDFAHTPDSINKLLRHISKYKSNNIISLFGCVGYSNSEKRKEIAEVVAKYSDKIIITSDNSGNTSFEDITKDIIMGINNKEYYLIEDRFTAIKFGINKLKDNDILVLIGKGAENFQMVGIERVPYSDIDSVKFLLEQINL